MSPRPYRLGERRAAIEKNRARILEAARGLLGSKGGISRLTLDAVADHAGVARMTVYYQFHSKGGLLEALFDHLAARGGMSGLRNTFQNPDPSKALDDIIAVFARFWASDRLVIRRIRALGAVDPDVGKALQARDSRRRRVLETVVERLKSRHQGPKPREALDLVPVLYTLTSFETFDTLAGDADIETVTPTIQRLVRMLVAPMSI